MEMNNRRKLVIAIGAGALASPFGAFAQQQGKVWRIGFQYGASRQSALETGRYGAFLKGMQDLGYIEGKHFVLEEQFIENTERFPDLSAELVRTNVDVIVTSGLVGVRTLLRLTTTIPIVVAVAFDPVRDRIAASLAHPGGNVTGLSALLEEVFAKHVELLKMAVPKLSRIAVFSTPRSSDHPPLMKIVDATARKLGIQVLEVSAATVKDLEPGFRTMAREQCRALIILGDTFFVQNFRQIAELAIKYRQASTYSGSEYPNVGGLMSYGPSFADNYYRAAAFVDKILKGAKPADLPFEQPTRVYLTINRKTAKALGLTIPQELLLRADKVIE
jgi:putative ABC transport system substrate-binding protein